MAELCKKCFIKEHPRVKESYLVMSENFDLCESCLDYNYTVDYVEEKGFRKKLIELVSKIGW